MPLKNIIEKAEKEFEKNWEKNIQGNYDLNFETGDERRVILDIKSFFSSAIRQAVKEAFEETNEIECPHPRVLNGITDNTFSFAACSFCSPLTTRQAKFLNE